MENPFKNYLSRQQIADKCGVRIWQVYRWDLPKPDWKPTKTQEYWLISTIDKWLKDVESGKIKKTKIANKAS